MFLRKMAISAVAAIVAASWLTGCGSTSGGGAAGSTQQGLAGQICGQQAAAKPGYPRTIPKIDGGATSLSGAGSTFVAPAMSVWTKDYSQSDGVQVAYQPIGPGGGVQQIVAATVDFGASDTPMKSSELAAAKFGPILHVPLTLGAVVPAYNVKGVQTGLKFDGDTLGKIFAGKITKWNDPALVALNPGTTLPDQPIAVAHRSDGSGTTALWTDFLTKESPTWVISTLDIEDLIAELKQDYTIVIVTHNMQQAARVSDQTAFFNLEAPDVWSKSMTPRRFSPSRTKRPPRITFSGRFG